MDGEMSAYEHGEWIRDSDHERVVAECHASYWRLHTAAKEAEAAHESKIAGLTYERDQALMDNAICKNNMEVAMGEEAELIERAVKAESALRRISEASPYPGHAADLVSCICRMKAIADETLRNI
jgi:hypothetical protein